MINCLITGVGGQGTVLASKLIAEGAIESGYKVRTTETIGMAQRGGSVVSHVRIGEEIFSPLISKGQADLIIAFEPAEAVRVLPYLKKQGCMIVNTEVVKPIINPDDYRRQDMIAFLKQKVPNLTLVEGSQICEVCKNTRVLNIALLGAAAKQGVLPVTKEMLEKAIKHQMKEKLVEVNLKALNMGYEGEA